MIKDSFGYGRTKARYLKWKAQYDDYVERKPDQNLKEWEDRKSCMEHDLDVLKDEIQDYEDLAQGKLQLPPLDEIDGIGRALVRWRIGKGWTAEEIADRTGIDFVCVVDYNVREFRTAPLEHVIQIRDLLLNQSPTAPFDYYYEAIAEAPQWAEEENYASEEA